MTNKIDKDITNNLDASKNYVVALSGGVDSGVLATVVAKQNHNLRSVFVRHNQKHSKELEEIANKIANNLKIRHKNLDSNLEKNSSETKMREARYEILYKELKENEILLMGHTLSDKVETFFINLLRGTRVRGLKSIPKITGKVIRPLLGISKNDLIDYAKENNIQYLDDKTNFDNKIIRNWIRNELIPKVDEKFAGNIEEKISNLIIEIESIFESADLEFKYVKTAKGYVEIPAALIKSNGLSGTSTWASKKSPEREAKLSVSTKTTLTRSTLSLSVTEAFIVTISPVPTLISPKALTADWIKRPASTLVISGETLSIRWGPIVTLFLWSSSKTSTRILYWVTSVP